MYNGFVNLNKTPGMSSNLALIILKKTLKQNNIQTKVGHFGTLDPMASGVLPVALGRATRLFDYSLDKQKKYLARFRFGVETDTLDSTGIVLATGRSDVTREEILSVIPSLVGSIDQVPPNYSAKTINGVRAYKMARKGEVFSLPSKRVTIVSISLLQEMLVDDHIEFSFEIVCGGGTYIRSIVRDMAYALDTVGIMTDLIRTASGDFLLEEAVTLSDFEKNPTEYFLPMERFLYQYPKIPLNYIQHHLLKNGLSANIYEFDEELSVLLQKCESKGECVVVVDSAGTIMGIGEVNEGRLKLKTWLL